MPIDWGALCLQSVRCPPIHGKKTFLKLNCPAARLPKSNHNRTLNRLASSLSEGLAKTATQPLPFFLDLFWKFYSHYMRFEPHLWKFDHHRHSCIIHHFFLHQYCVTHIFCNTFFLFVLHCFGFPYVFNIVVFMMIFFIIFFFNISVVMNFSQSSSSLCFFNNILYLSSIIF